ncbi:MAG TPA: D-alanine--D-alanine ligase family protein [Solirubrobacteraceae bacterium]|nr:D-alanine--D-alanine ligase family protein [Solirubrobacteraceae bacterium]
MRVAVLRGGRSSEHEVSLAGGRAVADGLAAAGHDVVLVDIGRDGVWRAGGEEIALRPERGLLGADVAFPVLHGPYGEDGSVQGALEVVGVPYVGSGVTASAICIDKLLLKDLMARAGMPQVAYARATEETDPEVVGLPCWVKPARLGSSVGIVRVDEPAAFAPAVREALAHDARVIVEAHAPGLEVECSVLGPEDAPQASEPGEIVLRAGAGWYDYEAKYTEGGMELVVPARVSAAARERVRELAVAAFALAGCSGLARVDFFVSGDDVLLNELNTMPGQTPTSVYAKLWEAGGVAYPDLLERLCRIGIERHRRAQSLRW